MIFCQGLPASFTQKNAFFTVIAVFLSAVLPNATTLCVDYTMSYTLARF